MKWFRPCAVMMAGWLLLGVPGDTYALTAEQKEVATLVQKVYSYDPDTFEYGNFDKNNQPLRIVRDSDGSLGGRYKPKLQCEFYKNFFVDALIVPEKKGRGCEPIFVRYPTVGDENLGSTTRYIPLPSPKIGTPEVLDDKAKVAVITGKGRTL